jgi:hypothetical protein
MQDIKQDNKRDEKTISNKIYNYFYINREQKYAKRYLGLAFTISQMPAIDRETTINKINQIVIPELSYYIYLTELQRVYPEKYKNHISAVDKYNMYEYCSKHFIDRHGEQKLQSFINNIIGCDVFTFTDSDTDYFLASDKKYTIDEMEAFTFDYVHEIEQCVYAINNIDMKNEKQHYDWILSKFPVELIEMLRDKYYQGCVRERSIIEAILLREKGQFESYENIVAKYTQDINKKNNDDDDEYI